MSFKLSSKVTGCGVAETYKLMLYVYRCDVCLCACICCSVWMNYLQLLCC